ncbi:MAG: hypothetical protein IPO82_03940 [Betaproteobacteria bacterium]|nr:hypothetical protein [Betaproteobacteria bacterium]
MAPFGLDGQRQRIDPLGQRQAVVELVERQRGRQLGVGRGQRAQVVADQRSDDHAGAQLARLGETRQRIAVGVQITRVGRLPRR